MPFITVNSSGPDIAEGVYPLILTDIKGPKTVLAQRGPKAGQEIQLFDWIFAIDNPGQPGDALEVNTSSSTASGPRSKMYAFLTALYGGVAPSVGATFEKTDLIGRRVLGTLSKDEEGWIRIANLSALPTSMLQQKFAEATGVAAAPPAAAAPLRETVAAGAKTDGDLPF